jgi:hypothetical protein
MFLTFVNPCDTFPLLLLAILRALTALPPRVTISVFFRSLEEKGVVLSTEPFSVVKVTGGMCRVREENELKWNRKDTNKY